MVDLNDAETLAEAIADVAFDVLSRLGDDPDARYAFFKQFVEPARDVGKRAINRVAALLRIRPRGCSASR